MGEQYGFGPSRACGIEERASPGVAGGCLGAPVPGGRGDLDAHGACLEPQLLRRGHGPGRHLVGTLLQAVVDHDRARRDARLRRLERDGGGEGQRVSTAREPHEHGSVDGGERRAHGAADLGGRGVEARARVGGIHGSTVVGRALGDPGSRAAKPGR